MPKQDVDASEYFVAYFEELKGLEGIGDTLEESIEDLNAAKETWFEKMLGNRFKIPLPK
ncbi:type II toxin-antitoxin system HicB family antitoxin [Salinicoccus sp. HZC-1]|uniref:type II toxin-antitoxin system HicB family antitoxin n=1 Tax=Salinicoccus sp. HZC-1 TaxID=3385497 RepID=UPI00398AA14E